MFVVRGKLIYLGELPKLKSAKGWSVDATCDWTQQIRYCTR
jgi:hypothetical protein